MSEKKVYWVGTARDDLKAFPDNVKQALGYQLHKIQMGGQADDSKPLKGDAFKGVFEIRERYDKDIYRVVYSIKIKNTVYVLHCFQKKSQKTPQKDLDIIARRIQIVMAEKGGK